MLDETKLATNSSNKHKVSSTKNNYMKHKKIPNAITQLVNDLINVVSFKVSISYNKPLVDDLETYQEKGWKKKLNNVNVN